VCENGNILLVCLYVNDLIFTGNNPSMFEDFNKAMTQEFEMTDIGIMSYYLGIEVKQYEVGLVSRYMELSTITHFKAAKIILRYVKGTINFGLFYPSSNEFKLVGYSNSDWGGDVDNRKSTTGFVFYLGSSAFTWSSKKQPIVTLSTCEAEYVAATSSVCHAI
jgi:hypothetical protein